MIFSIFYQQIIPQYFLPNFESIGLLVQEKKCKIYFQDGNYGGRLGFPIQTILASFNLQVTLILPTVIYRLFNYFKHHVYYVSINNFIYYVSINNFLEQHVDNNMFMSLILERVIFGCHRIFRSFLTEIGK